MALRHFCYLRNRLQIGDLIIVPSRPVELIFSVALVAKVTGAKVLLDIRDIWPDALIISNRFKKAVFSIYCNVYLHIALRMIDNFVHIAPCFQDWGLTAVGSIGQATIRFLAIILFPSPNTKLNAADTRVALFV